MVWVIGMARLLPFWRSKMTLQSFSTFRVEYKALGSCGLGEFRTHEYGTQTELGFVAFRDRLQAVL